MEAQEESLAQDRHSEELHEMITAVPSWLLRSGINAMLVCTVIFIIFTHFIHAPETVDSPITISSTAQAKIVTVRTQSRLVKVLVADRALVEPGTTLAYLECTADHESLLKLLPLLKKLQHQISAGLRPDCDSVLLLGKSRLGEVQGAFTKFHEMYLAYADVSRQAYYQQKRLAFRQDQQNLTKQYQKLQAQELLSQRSVLLAGDDFSMHETLAAQHVETKAEMRMQESNYLSKKMPLIQNENAMINNQIAASAVRKEILDLDNMVAVNRADFEQAVGLFISAVEDWKSEFTLTAPARGTLVYAGNIQENDEVASGREVFCIRLAKGRFFGIMRIPPDKLGRIRTGQRVIVKLDGYPFEEFGQLYGRISKINDFAAEGMPCSAYVSLPESVNEVTWIREALKGNAEVITAESTLFQRLTRSITRAVGATHF